MAPVELLGQAQSGHTFQVAVSESTYGIFKATTAEDQQLLSGKLVLPWSPHDAASSLLPKPTRRITQGTQLS